jgi:hypothetical protein
MESITKVNGEIIRQEQLNPAQLLTLAVDKDLDVEKLSKLMDLQRQWQAEQNRKAFFEAFIEFQTECPDIRKTKGVSFGGAQTPTYHYAPLADIVRQIKPFEKKCGFSHRWEFNDTKDELKVTCLLTHKDGHTERTTMQSSPDVSTGKNSIQARGSAIEYLKRYTLIGALGLSTTDSDIDGRIGEYETDVDKLHKTFMETYDQVILIDPNLNKWNPDNWLIERTGKNYIKAIGEIRKILFELQKKKA